MHFVLYLYVALTGHQPMERAFPMKDLDTCMEAVHAILKEEAPAALNKTNGGTFQASCLIVQEKKSDPTI